MTRGATRRFIIRGHVQGVGFRYATQREAQRLGLKGWVRNCRDYSVEARAAGNSDSLDALELWLQHGPPGAQVERVESSIPNEADTPLQATGFEILR